MKRSKIVTRLFAVGQALVLAIAMAGLQQGMAKADSGFTLSAPAQINTSPLLTWTPQDGVGTYTVYRNGRKYRAVNGSMSQFTDTTITEGTYSYYVRAAFSDGTTAQTNIVDVAYDPTPPTITATVSPQQQNGWNNSDTTVSFTCDDDFTGVASCTSPVTVTDEVSNLNVIGTAIDGAGNATYTSVLINIDRNAPTQDTLQASLAYSAGVPQATVSVNVNDTESGVAASEFYIDTDPGVGNGTPLTYDADAGTASAQVDVPDLSPGTHTIYVRTMDAAGNWSTILSTTADLS